MILRTTRDYRSSDNARCLSKSFICGNYSLGQASGELRIHHRPLFAHSQISSSTMPTNYDIGGKVIALTGGASGIGLQTAILLASQGAILSMADISEGPLKEVAAKIESTGGKVLATVVDVRDDKQVDAWIKATVEKFGKLDGAVNLAGVIPKCINVERVEDLNNEDWKFVLDVNLTGVMYCMRAQLQNMNVKGSVVNAASICGVIGFPKNAAYTASKHAVIGLSRAAAKEVGDREIRINCIAP